MLGRDRWVTLGVWLLLGTSGGLLLWQQREGALLSRLGGALVGLSVAAALLFLGVAVGRWVDRVGLFRLSLLALVVSALAGAGWAHKRSYARAFAACEQAAWAPTVAAREQALWEGEQSRAAFWLVLPEPWLNEQSAQRCQASRAELDRLRVDRRCPALIPEDALCECGRDRWPEHRASGRSGSSRPACTPAGIRYLALDAR